MLQQFVPLFIRNSLVNLLLGKIDTEVQITQEEGQAEIRD